MSMQRSLRLKMMFTALTLAAGLCVVQSPKALAQSIVQHMVFGGPNNNGTAGCTITGLIFGSSASWKFTLSGPGLNYTQTFTPNPSFTFNNITLPQLNAAYTETLKYLGTPSQSYTSIIYSSYIGSYMQEEQKALVSLAFGNAAPGGSNFPYTIGIRVHGGNGTFQSQTVNQPGDSTGAFSVDFTNLPSNTVYDWCIVHGTVINPSDPTTATFLSQHHVATTSI